MKRECKHFSSHASRFTTHEKVIHDVLHNLSTSILTIPPSLARIVFFKRLYVWFGVLHHRLQERGGDEKPWYCFP